MAQPDPASLARGRMGWSTTMGVTTAVLGLFLIAYPLVRSALTTELFGWVLILACIAQFVFGLHTNTIWNFLMIALRSAIFGIAGGWLVFFPPADVEMLAALLVAVLLAGAGVEGGLALLLRPDEGRRWVLFDAVTGFLTGVLVLAGWPSGSVRGMGVLVGVALLANGIARTGIASRMRSDAEPVARARPYRRAA